MKTASTVAVVVALSLAPYLVYFGTRSPGPEYVDTGPRQNDGEAVVGHAEPPSNPPAVEHLKFTLSVGGWNLGATDAKGNYIFAGENARIHLLSQFGFMFLNEGTYEHPKPAYALGFLKEKKVIVMRSIAALQAELKKIPRKSRVYLYDVCTAGTAPGVGGKPWKAVTRAFRKAHLKFSEDDCIRHCTCPESDLDSRIPDAFPGIKDGYIRVYGRDRYIKHLRSQ